MCEFKVYVEEAGKERTEVARNIIMVKKKEENILLVDDMGTVTLVNNASIVEANTFTLELILRK